MIKLFYPIFRGEVEFIGYTAESLEKYFYNRFPYLKGNKHITYYAACRVENDYYCYPQYLSFIINEQLKKGKVLIGVDNDEYIFTDKKNIIP